MAVSNVPNADYAFPHVRFNETTLGPIPFTPEWRNTIGVAGVFSKGPIGPTRISSRQEFASLYSEDDSSGSLFVREAMLQGATNFIISRVMPSSKPAAGLVSLQSSSNPTVNEAFISTGSDRTIGLSLQMSYVGSPSVAPGEFLGEKVAVRSNSTLDLTTFGNYTGTGVLQYEMREKVITSAITPSATIAAVNIKNIAANGIQQLTIDNAVSPSGVTALKAKAKPGLVIVKAVGDSSTATLPSNGLQILTYPYESATGQWSILVQGTVTAATTTTGSDTGIVIQAPSTGNFFILSYNYSSPDGGVLPTGTVPANTYSFGNALGFYILNSTQKGWVNQQLLKLSTGIYSWQPTGIYASFGDTASTDPLELIPGASFSIPFVRGVVTVGETNTAATGFPNTLKAFTAGTSSAEILAQLKQQMLLDNVISTIVGDVLVNDALVPYSLSFETNFEGLEANRVNYSLSRTVSSGTPTDIQFGSGGASYDIAYNMQGGQDGMRPASIYLYDVAGNPLVYIEALSPGVAGNKIQISVRPAPPGKFRLDVVDTAGLSSSVPSLPETFLLSNYNVSTQSGVYSEVLDSKLIRAYFLPVALNNSSQVRNSIYNLVPQRVAPVLSILENSTAVENILHPSHRGVSYLTNLSLAGGSEPVNYATVAPPDEDYVEALRRLEPEDIALLCAAGITVSDVRYEQTVTELLIQAERSSTFNGLRIGIVSAPPRLTVSRAASITSGLSSERLVVVSGYATLAGARYLGTNSVAPDGFYAGVLSVIPPHVSPASVYAGRSVAGAISTDAKNDPTYLDPLTRSRVEVLHFDTGLQLYKFLNGLTTSSDSTGRWVSIRRLADQIIMDLYRNLQWVRSAPNDRDLRSRVASAVDAYLRTLLRDGQIFGFQPTVCDESNNSQFDASQGRLNVSVTYTPIFPADYINVTLIRDVTTEFSLSTGQ